MAPAEVVTYHASYFMRLIVLLLLSSASLCLTAGCAMDVASPGSSAQIATLEAELEVVELDLALLGGLPAGCEDLDGSLRALSRPGLGALVGPGGDVLCVDSLVLLIEEDAERRYVHALRADPTPTPLMPGSLGAEPDPTPTPVLDP